MSTMTRELVSIGENLKTFLYLLEDKIGKLCRKASGAALGLLSFCLG